MADKSQLAPTKSKGHLSVAQLPSEHGLPSKGERFKIHRADPMRIGGYHKYSNWLGSWTCWFPHDVFIHHKIKSAMKVKDRRMSYGFGSIPGIRPLERTSVLGMEFKRPILQYLPTYQLAPTRPFHIPTVQNYVAAMIEENFEGHKYHPQVSPQLCLRLAGEIMRGIKAMQFNRYRIIVVVTIGQKRAQSYNNTISFIWDHEFDCYVNYNKEVHTAFIQCTVFGVYFD